MPGKAKANATRPSRTTPTKMANIKRKTAAASPKRTLNRPSRGQPSAGAASRLIEQRIRELGGWRGETLGRMRALILEADPEMVEEIKWVKPSNPFGVPVWSHDGIVCTGEVYKEVVKLTFMRGARIPDPSRLFNASLEGGTRRAIDIREGATLDEDAFRDLVKAAVARNNRGSS